MPSNSASDGRSTTPSSWASSRSRRLEPMIRASVHYFNTEDEITRFCAAVDALCRNPK